MAKFRFEFDPLLKARKRAEEVHQRMVAAIERQRMEIEDSLRRQQAIIAHGKQSLRQGLVGPVDTQSLRLHAASSMQMMRSAQRSVLELAGIHKRLETARTALVEAAKERRAMELLRDRRFSQWKAAIEKRDTATMDELAVIAAARRHLADNTGMEIEP
jgi:flagellar FliJ protein